MYLYVHTHVCMYKAKKAIGVNTYTSAYDRWVILSTRR